VQVLALFDIHGNVDALEAVLADPAAAGAEAVVVGGDAVPGPFGAEVLARLRALTVPVHWVRGNGEREVAAAAAGGAQGATPPEVAARASAAQLDPAEAAALGRLPLTLELDGVLVCHASPRRDDEILTRISDPGRYAAALEDVLAPVVLAGHTHQQDDRRAGTTRWVNAGSVGLPYEGDAAARWAWIDDGVPELRSTAYDAQAAGRRMLDAGFDPDSVTAALLEPIEAMEVTALFEGRASVSG
jgi:predicted phosphodiesterase